MDTENQIFELVLTPGELYWLAKALGLQRIQLPADPYSGWLVDEISLDVDQGRQSLEERSLIIPSGINEWNIDDVVLGLVHWMAEAKKNIVVDVYQLAIQPIHMIIFSLLGAGLLLKTDGRKYHLTVFKEAVQLKKYIADISGIANQKNGSAKTELSKLQLDHLVKWVSSSDRKYGDKVPLAEFDIETIISLSIFLNDITNLKIQKQNIWLGNQEHLWTITSINADASQLLMEPESAEMALKKISIGLI